jgi:hypothetical protein
MGSRSRLHPVLLAASLALAGCAADGDFPSLAMRPAERERSMEPPVRAPVEVPSDAALRARIGELVAAANAGEREFGAAYPVAEAAVRAAGAPGSESWVAAQQALSRLEGTRQATTRALGDLDQLTLRRADQPTSAEDYAALTAAVADVERIAAGQQERYDRLRTRLSGR